MSDTLNVQYNEKYNNCMKVPEFHDKNCKNIKSCNDIQISDHGRNENENNKVTEYSPVWTI